MTTQPCTCGPPESPTLCAVHPLDVAFIEQWARWLAQDARGRIVDGGAVHDHARGRYGAFLELLTLIRLAREMEAGP